MDELNSARPSLRLASLPPRVFLPEERLRIGEQLDAARGRKEAVEAALEGLAKKVDDVNTEKKKIAAATRLIEAVLNDPRRGGFSALEIEKALISLKIRNNKANAELDRIHNKIDSTLDDLRRATEDLNRVRKLLEEAEGRSIKEPDARPDNDSPFEFPQFRNERTFDLVAIAEEQRRQIAEVLDSAGQPLRSIQEQLIDIGQVGAESARELEDAYLGATQAIRAALGEVFKNGKFNFSRLEQAAIGSLDEILNKILEILDQDLFKGFFSKILGGGGGPFGNILGGVGGLLGLAGGGAVQPKLPVLVGERGPEIFVPPSVGSIVPNSRIGGGGPPVTFNQTIHFDVGLESVDSRIAQAAAPIAAQAVAAIEEARERDFR